MSILVGKETRVVGQGITGTFGSLHATKNIEYGTNYVAAVTPGKGGGRFRDSLPIFNTVREAVEKEGANTSVIFVPPAFAADGILEAIDAGIELIVCITEGIPVQDMAVVKDALYKADARLVGPNCPGRLQHRDPAGLHRPTGQGRCRQPLRDPHLRGGLPIDRPGVWAEHLHRHRG